jgi:serine/threonine-protein kinase
MIGKNISHYKILELLGKGGMGEVYKAEDTKLKRTVALKFISKDKFENSENKIRFINEAQAAASLNHPHINTIYEIDEAEGETFIAMEYMDGNSLKNQIKSQLLEVETAIDLAIQIAEGLQEAHENGIIHRDIKSSNIMVTSRGQAKIMDFGLAKSKEGTRITGTAVIVGTVSFMSPEQACKETVDSRTDIWSFGVMLYEMLTGQLPFKGEHDQIVLYSILNDDPYPITGLRRGIPLELERIVFKCLDKEPDARYQTALDLRADLKRLTRDISEGRTYSYQTGGAHPAYRRRKALRRTALPALLVMLLIVLAFTISPVRKSIKGVLGLSSLPEIKVLAVLPFDVSGNGGENTQIYDGLDYTLSHKLSQLEGFQGSLQVIPFDDVIEMGIKSALPARKKIGANLVVTGQVVLFPDKIQLLLGVSSTHFPPIQITTSTVEVSRKEEYKLNDTLVNAVAKMIVPEIKPEEVSRVMAEGGSDNPDALIFYGEGLGYMQHSYDVNSLNIAIEKFDRSIKEDPKFAQAYVDLGRAYWEKWELTKETLWAEKAKSICRKALEINDTLVHAYIQFGIILRETGEYKQAVANLLRSIELDGSNVAAHKELALTYEKQGSLEDSEKEYLRAIELMPDNGRGYIDLGVFYFYHGKYEEAEKRFEKAADILPGNFNSHMYLGVIYQRTDRLDLAIKNYKRSNKIKPNYSSYSNLGTIYFFKTKYNKAKKLYEKALRHTNNELYEYAVWGNLADTYRYTGEEEKVRDTYLNAIRLVEKLIEVNPNDAPLCGQLARYYAHVGNQKNAFVKISRALKLEPKNVEVLQMGVKVFELIDRRDLALKCLQDFIACGGNVQSEIDKSPDLEKLREDPRYKKLVVKE